MGYAIRTDRYRYVEWLDRTTRELVERELYDHAKDPGEDENIASKPEHAALLVELNQQMGEAFPAAAKRTRD